jgi:DNA-binding MarR family transcriptional regulator
MSKRTVNMDDSWELPLGKMITFRVARVHAKITAQATRVLKENSPLSLFQWRILVSIQSLKNPTHSKIIATTNVDGGQLSRSIKKMIESGMLESHTDKADSRQQYLSITKKGVKAYQGARPDMRKRQAKFINALTEAEQDTLFRILTKLEAVCDDKEFVE